MPAAAEPARLPAWARPLHAIAEDRRFQSAMLGVILIASLLAGLDTYEALKDRFGPAMLAADRAILAVFTAEILIRLGAHGHRPWRFFRDAWNVFDLAIVVVCLLPVGAEHAVAARLVRLLRVFRLFSGVPRLRLLIGAMVRAVPSIGYVSLLLLLLFYVYAILGTSLFRANDPVHFGDMHTAMLSLLRTVTLEDWTDLMYTQIYGSDVYGYGEAAAKLTDAQRAIWTPRAMPIIGTAYFVSFVLVGTMIVLNLFVGVVLSSLSDAQAALARETLARARGRDDLDARLRSLEAGLGDMQSNVAALRTALADADRRA